MPIPNETGWELIWVREGKVETTSDRTGEEREDRGADGSGPTEVNLRYARSGLEDASYQELQEGVVALGWYHVDRLRQVRAHLKDQIRTLQVALAAKDVTILELREQIECLQAGINP
ncbi:hypothetical protein PQX77_002957 [Marasmius sp. AFHP31]|nr:hypothetical protein PQX77_002957 [Marasmius sp. AFHP31]